MRGRETGALSLISSGRPVRRLAGFLRLRRLRAKDAVGDFYFWKNSIQTP